MIVLFVLSVLLKVAFATDSKTLLYNPRPNLLVDAVEEIIDKHFAVRQPIINLISSAVEFNGGFAIKDFLDELLDKRFKSSNLSYRQERSNKLSVLSHRRRRATVLTISSYDGFNQYFSQVASGAFKFNGYYLIVLVNGEIKEIENIFQRFWSIQIYNVNAIFKDEKGEVVVKTFMPFRNNSCNFTSPILINQFSNGSFTRDVNKIFPRKMFNLFQCPIRVALANDLAPAVFANLLPNQSYSLNGRDIRLLETIAQSLNFRIDYTFIGVEGFLLDNGTAEGPFRALRDRSADISISDWWIKQNRLKYFDSSTSYNSDQIVFIVPPGREFTAFEVLVFPFSTPLWLLILMCFFLGFLFIFVIRFQSKRVQSFVFGTNTGNPYINLINGFLGGTQNNLPSFNFARYLLVMLLIYSLVIRTLYQASFFKLLKSNAHFKGVQSIDDIVERDYKIFVNSETADIFSESTVLKNRLQFVEAADVDSVLHKIQSDSSFKGAFGKSLLQVYYMNQMSPVESRFDYCSDIVLTLPIVIYTLKDFYLIDAINEKIEVLKSSGFIDFWQHELIDKASIRDQDSKPPKMLTLHDFKGSIHILVVGCTLGLIVFMIELLKGRRKRNGLLADRSLD